MHQQYSILKPLDTSLHTACVTNDSRTLASMAKALLGDALGIILAWCPTIAMILGKVVTRLWPGFRRV